MCFCRVSFSFPYNSLNSNTASHKDFSANFCSICDKETSAENKLSIINGNYFFPSRKAKARVTCIYES